MIVDFILAGACWLIGGASVLRAVIDSDVEIKVSRLKHRSVRYVRTLTALSGLFFMAVAVRLAVHA